MNTLVKDKIAKVGKWTLERILCTLIGFIMIGSCLAVVILSIVFISGLISATIAHPFLGVIIIALVGCSYLVGKWVNDHPMN